MLSVPAFLRRLLAPDFAEPRSFYTVVFVLEFLSFLVICFGWSGFRQERTASTAQLLQENQIPQGLLVYALGQFLLILTDRAIHLLRAARTKLALHYCTLFFMHLLVFYILPASTGRPLASNPILIALYLLKCGYFAASAAQLRASYPAATGRSTNWREYTLTGYLAFLVYRAVPFLCEVRMLMDWTCTSTTLELDSWFKLEDIYGQLFINRGRIATEQARSAGTKQPLTRKLLKGALFVGLLIVVIWSPLLIMSVVNDNAIANPPVRITATLTVGSFAPLYAMDVLPAPASVSTQEYKVLQDMDDTGFVSEYARSDVQRALLSADSKEVWSISPTSRAALVTGLATNRTMTLSLALVFERRTQTGVAARVTSLTQHNLAYGSEERSTLLQALSNEIKNGSGVSTAVHLSALFPTVVHLTKADRPDTNAQLPEYLRDLAANCTLRRHADAKLDVEWWSLEQTSPHVLMPPGSNNSSSTSSGGGTLPDEAESSLEVITLNDRAASETLAFLSAYGIVGLYVSVVLVVGRFLRLLVDQASHRIVYEEMPQVDALTNLCDAIYTARDFGDMAAEEALWHMLRQLYRSPEALIIWSRPHQQHAD